LKDSNKLIVADTGAIITLEKMSDGFGFIQKLYKKIIIPSQVLEELHRGNQYESDYLDFYNIRELIDIQQVPIVTNGLGLLDYGERYAISLALQLKCPLLIEDRNAKEVAESKGGLASGIAGRVLTAFSS
jgi:predicted nucleic acid-binding protein